MTTPVPHDLDAERAVLGAMMLSAVEAEKCMQALDTRDFYRPQHGVIFAHIIAAVRAGDPVDPVTIKDRLLAAGEFRGNFDPVYLAGLIEAVPLAANASLYARIVRDRAVRRRLLEAGRRITDWAADEPAGEAHGLTERALREIEDVRDAGMGDGLTVQTITEFLDVPEDDAYDWVVPGLLERGDRLILTGIEGAGKSTLFRMFAVCIAAGIHPFTFAPMRPGRVLLLDCENTERHTRRKIRPLISQARLQGHEVSEANLWIECRPAGIDLARDKDVSWLMRQVSAVGPDVTFLGPLYRLAPRALNDDSDAAPILATLNMVRARNSAVVLEAHAGHSVAMGGMRDLRPRGSSAFLGWPEFGYGLRWAEGSTKDHRVVEMASWRGDRDEREWPEMLAAGGAWPWRPYEAPPVPKGDSWNVA